MNAENPLKARARESLDVARTADVDPAEVLRLCCELQEDDDDTSSLTSGWQLNRKGQSGERPFALITAFSFRATPTVDVTGPNITASLFLSLILLVLAFFIVMVSMSDVDADRSAGVIGSIAATFASGVSMTSSPVSPGAQRGDVVDGEDLEQSFKRLFATELAVAEFKAVVPGRVLEITVAGDVLFHRDEARVRAVRSRLLERLVATVTIRPPGQRVEVQALISSRTSGGGNLPVAPSHLAISRAGALAEALVRRGLPRSQLTVGLWPEKANRIVFVFSLVGVEDSDVPDRAALGGRTYRQ